MDDQERINKMGWLRSSMNGDDEEIIRALVATLPATKELDADGTKQLDRARAYMAELFLRGVSYRKFNVDCGLYGFPVYPAQPGMTRHKLFGDKTPVYYSFWLLDKEPEVSATAVKNTLLFLKEQYGEAAGDFVIQLYLDVDNTAKGPHAMPLDPGLTKRAFCVEFVLSEAESHFALIEAALPDICRHARNKVRFGLGKLGGHEYDAFCKLRLNDPHVPFGTQSEFLLCRNIRRRAEAQAAKRAATKANE
jgi:hypothetical protein